MSSVVGSTTLRSSPMSARSCVIAAIATGAGAESRQAIGVVVFYGVLISVFLTLGVVPAVYTLVARNTRSPEAIGQLLDRLREGLPAVSGGAKAEPRESRE